MVKGKAKTSIRGRGWFDKIKSFAKSAHDFIKDKKIVSSLLSKVGKQSWADKAASYGYGRRRRPVARRTKRVTRGRGFFGDLFSSVAPSLVNFGLKKLGGRRTARRRTTTRRGGARTVRRHTGFISNPF